jgi:hypothetical protein
MAKITSQITVRLNKSNKSSIPMLSHSSIFTLLNPLVFRITMSSSKMSGQVLHQHVGGVLGAAASSLQHGEASVPSSWTSPGIYTLGP